MVEIDREVDREEGINQKIIEVYTLLNQIDPGNLGLQAVYIEKGKVKIIERARQTLYREVPVRELLGRVLSDLEAELGKYNEKNGQKVR